MAKASQFPITTVDELLCIAETFLDLHRAMPRGLNRVQCNGWQWLSDAFYSESIEEQCRVLPRARQDRISKLIAQVEVVLEKVRSPTLKARA